MSTTTTPLGTTPLVARTVADLREHVARLRADGRRVALVPTMGAFHEGHLSLMRLAGADDHAVVVSLFVNPTQFGPGEDLSAYPRDEDRDVALTARAGVELVFVPDVGEIYPGGFGTRVTVEGPTRYLEGASRPSHFSGVTTVVAKLLIAARPDRAVFGQKDAQQVAVIRRLVADLHLDEIDLVIAPIVRERDGLAMSSRNAYLEPEDRAAALALRRALDAGLDLASSGEQDPRAIERTALGVLSSEPRCEPVYASVVNPATFEPVAELTERSLLCVAAQVGPARLIDNDFIEPNPA
jgi:pantoate--beta-alanine ligase